MDTCFCNAIQRAYKFEDGSLWMILMELGRGVGEDIAK